MHTSKVVDVAINVFAKPYQTALSVLSLLKYSHKHIDKIYFQFEPYGSKFDTLTPYIIAEYLNDQAICTQPQEWIALNPINTKYLDDPQYRYAIRYQYAWEHTDKEYLFIMHNDVLFFKDILKPMLEGIHDAFAIGSVGQCWNCPAARADLVSKVLPGKLACTPEDYLDFHLTYDELKKLYDAAAVDAIFTRPYLNNADYFIDDPWPLPECRVNEWACLINMKYSAQLTCPKGNGFPFGAFEQCGEVCLDTGVRWFRDLHKAGGYVKNLDLRPYVQHWVGNGKMSEYKYTKAEFQAKHLLNKHFPQFIQWGSEKGYF